jgi:hypothetical protein
MSILKSMVDIEPISAVKIRYAIMSPIPHDCAILNYINYY